MKKVAIITGGIRGIGLGTGKVFLKKGYQVVLNYHSDQEEAKKVLQDIGSSDVVAVQADISCPQGREKLLSQTVEAFGRYDVLVNNAGIINLGRFLDFEPQAFEKVMNTNFYAALYLSQRFAQNLVEKKQAGAIVNVASVGAYNPGNIAYCTSKAALIYATRCMARELAKHQIRVNSVSPGMVETNLNQPTREQRPEVWQEMLERCPMKRTASPEEMGEAIYFFASEEASFVTGRDLVVDGGYLG